MTVLAFLALLASGETVVLKENARVSGRFIRLTDLLEPEFTPEALRGGDIYLGRAPEEGSTRTVTLEEIRRELGRRGVSPDGLTFVGKRVEVARGREPAAPAVRGAIATEIKRLLLAKNPGERSETLVVTISRLAPESLPAECRVVEIRERGALEYSMVLVDPEKNRIEAEAVARVVRLRDAVVAARDIAPGKVLERGDLEMRRVESAESEAASTDLSSLIGATAALRIRKGAEMGPADLKAAAPVRRGDLVRAASSAFEVDARALEDGFPGQEIRLEFVASKNTFRARVAGAGRVEVVEGGK